MLVVLTPTVGLAPQDTASSATQDTSSSDAARGARAAPGEWAALLPELRRFAAKLLGSREHDADAEDCAHEALSRWLAGEHPHKGRAFLFGIVRNVVLDHRRKHVRRREDLTAPADSQTDLAKLAHAQPSAEETQLQRERHETLWQKLGELPESQRRALTAFFVEHRSYQQIAHELGVPLGTVATWIARGKGRLAHALAADHLAADLEESP